MRWWSLGLAALAVEDHTFAKLVEKLGNETHYHLQLGEQIWRNLV